MAVMLVCNLDQKPVTIDEALQMRGEVRKLRTPRLNFTCPRCGQAVRPHKASSHAQAHFEHRVINPSCPLASDRSRDRQEQAKPRGQRNVQSSILAEELAHSGDIDAALNEIEQKLGAVDEQVEAKRLAREATEAELNEIEAKLNAAQSHSTSGFVSHNYKVELTASEIKRLHEDLIVTTHKLKEAEKKLEEVVQERNRLQESLKNGQSTRDSFYARFRDDDYYTFNDIALEIQRKVDVVYTAFEKLDTLPEFAQLIAHTPESQRGQRRFTGAVARKIAWVAYKAYTRKPRSKSSKTTKPPKQSK